MLALARDGAAEGTWLYADQQTSGRGRQGRAWVSPPGNLYASGLVRLRVDDPLAASLALVTGVALADVTQSYAPAAPLQLKWPNDLLVNGAKLAGILLEREGDAVVIGVGANLAHHPDLPDRPATSLAALGVAPPLPAQMMADLAAQFDHWLNIWRAQGLPVIIAAWEARAHPIGTPLSAENGNGTRINGTFAGLDATGALILRLADGTNSVIHAGDVFLL